MSAAAGLLHVTQPALTRQLQQLERDLKVQLFDRSRGRLALTPAGRTFLESTDQVLNASESARSVADALAAGRVTRVRAASPTTTLTDVFAPFLATLRPDDPLITVEEAHYSDAIDGLRSRFDIAIVTSPPSQGLAVREIAVLPVWAYVPPSHELATTAEVTLEQLSEHTLVLLNGTFRPRRLLDEALEASGLAAPEIIECSNPQVAQALAAAERGIAVVSDDPRFGLVPLRVRSGQGSLTLTLHAAWNPAHHAANELAGIADRLSAFCADRYGSGYTPTAATQSRDSSPS